MWVTAQNILKKIVPVAAVGATLKANTQQITE